MGRLLIVDDNEAHIILQKNALKECAENVSILTAKNVKEAEKALFESDKKETPDLILLDSNLPGTSGLELLGKLKQDNNTRHIPVIMISSSENPALIKEAYQLGANSCLEKPGDYDEMIKMTNLFIKMWFKWNRKEATCN